MDILSALDMQGKGAEYPNYVWTYDCFEGATAEGWKQRFLTVELTRESRWIKMSQAVMTVLEGLLGKHGTPPYLRSDNGPEFIAKAVRGSGSSDWVSRPTK